MRIVPIALAALVAAPAAAQDHASHAEHSTHVTLEEHEMAQPAPEAEDHSRHDGMDHSQHAMEAESEPAMDHSQHEMDHSSHSEMDIPAGPPPARAFEGPQHAAELFFDRNRMAAARAYNHAAHGNMTTGMVLAERLEARLSDGHDAYLWDVSGWYGTATDKLVFKTEGEGELDSGAVDDAEVQLLWGHAIGPFVDLQLGVRADIEPTGTAHVAAGVAGLAPYMIHFDAAAFLSDEGDLTARIEAEHDMKFSQKLILQPRVEAELSAQDIPERGVGAGLSKIEIGARLRYEFVPEFAPYVGIEYEAATGQTADYIRAAGDDPDGLAVLVGLRFWF